MTAISVLSYYASNNAFPWANPHLCSRASFFNVPVTREQVPSMVVLATLLFTVPVVDGFSMWRQAENLICLNCSPRVGQRDYCLWSLHHSQQRDPNCPALDSTSWWHTTTTEISVCCILYTGKNQNENKIAKFWISKNQTIYKSKQHIWVTWKDV